MSRGRSSRRKGHQFERDTARALRETTGLDDSQVYRGAQSDGAHMPDVVAPGLWIECKKGKAPPYRPALEQAISNQGDAPEASELMPVAVVQQDRQHAVVVMLFEDWKKIYRDHVHFVARSHADRARARAHRVES